MVLTKELIASYTGAFRDIEKEMRGALADIERLGRTVSHVSIEQRRRDCQDAIAAAELFRSDTEAIGGVLLDPSQAARLEAHERWLCSSLLFMNTLCHSLRKKYKLKLCAWVYACVQQRWPPTTPAQTRPCYGINCPFTQASSQFAVGGFSHHRRGALF